MQRYVRYMRGIIDTRVKLQIKSELKSTGRGRHGRTTLTGNME